MTTFIHADSAKKWHEMTLSDQLANVGSEFSRMLMAKQNKKPARFESASHRFIELINLTLTDKRWTGRRKREIARLKEIVLDALMPPKEDIEGVQSLEKYFYYFGVSRQAEKRGFLN